LSLGRDSLIKLNENKSKRKINIDLAIVASQMPRGAIHDIIMQNSLIIQQLQLMVVLRQKEIEEEENKEENQWQKERETKEEEEKQNKLKEEEIRMMKEWREQES